MSPYRLLLRSNFIIKEEELKDIPVFIITNYTSKELEEIGLDLKSEKYLTKTKFIVKELVEMIKERLKE